MGTQAFTKLGNTVAIQVTTSTSTPVQVPSTTLGGNQYRIINEGQVTVFLGYGATATDATQTTAQVITTGPSLPLLPGTDEILTFVPNAYFAAICAANTAVVYITPGDGL